MQTFKNFRFWCQKVLPLVYDDSLSYYEVLCKVVHYINGLIDGEKELADEMAELKAEMAEVQKYIDNFDTAFAEKVIREFIGHMVFFGLTMSGYFVAYIPENWDNLTFETTGYDVEIPLQPEYGHLVLKY